MDLENGEGDEFDVVISDKELVSLKDEQGVSSRRRSVSSFSRTLKEKDVLSGLVRGYGVI